ncbi:hypothetical protein [Rathayibacter sp. VKM Ac-2927]|uniref:hypothetical protein n=1 Tax=Rathayibacter sp. VKM Ac-2927 TaxID=2929478 RepID=UPI001FB51DD0|nr:hypothetical protein [Rathayibacter sp. VKM Ac-2927]MCJ1687216.1 hypothetical protein [Rathayibacter sp. VKM Ac-2927]
MTPDQRHPDAGDPRPSDPAGVARRTAATAAETALVVAATATVTRGPVHFGPDPAAVRLFGATSSTETVQN